MRIGILHRCARRGAIILGAAGGGTIIGSIGSWTFQRSKFGNMIRSRVKPVDPNTPRQQAVKGLMTQISNAWDSATTAQRDGWRSYALNTDWISPKGQIVHLSGRDMFLRSQFFLGAYANSANPTPPGVTGLPNIPIVTFVYTAATGDLSVTAVNTGPVFGGWIINLLASRKLRPSRNFWKGPFEQTSFFLDSEILPFAALTIPGVAVAGDKIFVKYAMWESDNNRVSTHAIAEIIAV